MRWVAGGSGAFAYNQCFITVGTWGSGASTNDVTRICQKFTTPTPFFPLLSQAFTKVRCPPPPLYPKWGSRAINFFRAYFFFLQSMPTHSLLSRVQPIFSETDIAPCHEAKLPNIVSIGLSLRFSS
ncbi:hypothetical protein BsWGS_02701 [Bradybaena similaris]